MKFVIFSLFVLVLVAAQNKDDMYPESWLEIDARAIIDNDRLFRKYKECFLANSTVGCPPITIEIKRVVPEMIETLCAKCSPELVVFIKDVISYTCKTRKSDFRDFRKAYDPTGSVRREGELKHGIIDCDWEY